MVFKCSLKLNLLSRNIPKCFWKVVCRTTFSLRNKGEWLVVWNLQEKISSCACLVASGLKFIFQWNAHSSILFTSLFRSIFETSTFSTTEKSEVSPASNLGLMLTFQINHWCRLKTIVTQELNLGKLQLQP